MELRIALGSNTSQTARMLAALEPTVTEVDPDVVLVYGDTNSTLAGALAGAQAGVPVAHVEAGMRSFDRSMPEELNRVLADHASTLLLCSSQVAVDNLRREDVRWRGRAGRRRDGRRGRGGPAAGPRARPIWSRRMAVAPGEYVVCTAHRAGNVDDPARLERLVELLLSVPLPVVLPLHPRTRARLTEPGSWTGS